MKLYKILQKDGKCFWGGRGRWRLPRDENPGKWMPSISWSQEEARDEDVLCCSGYHLIEESDILRWAGPALFEAQGRGRHFKFGAEHIVSSARLLRRVEAWNDRTLRTLAIEFARHALSQFPLNPSRRAAFEGILNSAAAGNLREARKILRPIRFPNGWRVRKITRVVEAALIRKPWFALNSTAYYAAQAVSSLHVRWNETEQAEEAKQAEEAERAWQLARLHEELERRMA